MKEDDIVLSEEMEHIISDIADEKEKENLFGDYLERCYYVNGMRRMTKYFISRQCKYADTCVNLLADKLKQKENDNI